MDAEVCGLFLQDFVAVLVEAVALQLFQIFAQRLAGDGHHIEIKHRLDFLHHTGNAASIVEVLSRPIAGGANVQQVMCAAVHTVEGVGVNFNAELVRNRG